MGRRWVYWSLAGLLLSGSALAQSPAPANKPYLTVGLFFGRILDYTGAISDPAGDGLAVQRVCSTP